MNSILNLLIAIPFVFAFSSSDAATPAPIEKVVPVSNVFMAETVKSGNEVFAVANGLFPNGCYSYQRAEVADHPSDNFFEVKNFASITQGMCIMVLVPFSQEIKFGKLDVGTYNFRFLNGDGTYLQKKVVVE